MKFTPVLSVLAGLALSPAALAVCGDGNIESTEGCDDGNVTDGDGCDSTCAVEANWNCTDATFELDFNETFTGDGTHTDPSEAPIWTVSSDGRSVTQSVNSQPGIFVSTLPATGVTATFSISVNTTDDDDFIGWAVGYEQGDFTNAGAEWILFDWSFYA